MGIFSAKSIDDYLSRDKYSEVSAKIEVEHGIVTKLTLSHSYAPSWSEARQVKIDEEGAQFYVKKKGDWKPSGQKLSYQDVYDLPHYWTAAAELTEGLISMLGKDFPISEFRVALDRWDFSFDEGVLITLPHPESGMQDNNPIFFGKEICLLIEYDGHVSQCIQPWQDKPEWKQVDGAYEGIFFDAKFLITPNRKILEVASQRMIYESTISEHPGNAILFELSDIYNRIIQYYGLHKKKKRKNKDLDT